VVGDQIIHPVDIDTIELRIFDPATSEGTVEELYRFGLALFSEGLHRSSELDRKLTTVLGWAGATLAFLLLNHSKAQQFGAPGKVALLIATLAAFAALLLAAFALKTRLWPAPSEKDWFKAELWDDPSRMKRYHVISLLLVHQTTVKNVKRKATCLRWTEMLLPVGGLATASILLFSSTASWDCFFGTSPAPVAGCLALALVV